jgi:hypothetical protein
VGLQHGGEALFGQDDAVRRALEEGADVFGQLVCLEFT